MSSFSKIRYTLRALIMGVLVAVLFAAPFYCWHIMTPPLYRSYASMQILTKPGFGPTQSLLNEGEIVEIFQNNELHDTVQMRLEQDDRNQSKNNAIKDGFSYKYYPLDRVLNIIYEHSDPKFTAKVANVYADEFINKTSPTKAEPYAVILSIAKTAQRPHHPSWKVTRRLMKFAASIGFCLGASIPLVLNTPRESAANGKNA